jgi:hypothetical protein
MRDRSTMSVVFQFMPKGIKSAFRKRTLGSPALPPLTAKDDRQKDELSESHMISMPRSRQARASCPISRLLRTVYSLARSDAPSIPSTAFRRFE